MIRYARITRCSKMTPDSPGWRTPDQFKMVAAERYLKTYSGLLPAEFTNRALIEEYVICWNNAREKFMSKEHLINAKLSYSDENSHFFVLVFNSMGTWQARANFVNQHEEMQKFDAARDALAAFLQVKVDVYEPVELDMDVVIDASTLNTITQALDAAKQQ